MVTYVETIAANTPNKMMAPQVMISKLESCRPRVPFQKYAQ
jgi:hypothetical protein